MKLQNKIIRKINRLFGWRKPHPTYIEGAFNKLSGKMTQRQAVMEATSNPESVIFVYQIWNNEL